MGLNLGGPDSLEAVEPFLYRLFRDPEVIQLGWARPIQPLLARLIARRRAPVSRAAYAQIGGRSPILEETQRQVKAVADVLSHRGVAAHPYVAMACWHPFAEETVTALRADGRRRVIALSLYPHESRTTVGSSVNLLRAALDRGAGALGPFELTEVRHYPDAPGYVAAVAETVRDAIRTLPEPLRDRAPILFSAHGLPESYIRRGDPYLDEVRVTVAAVCRELAIESRARLTFQSRVGPQRWLGPNTEDVLDELAEGGVRAAVVCPVAFTGEHIETLQELDIVYRERAAARGLVHFARARAVGTHPSFITALADLCEGAAAERGWL